MQIFKKFETLSVNKYYLYKGYYESFAMWHNRLTQDFVFWSMLRFVHTFILPVTPSRWTRLFISNSKSVLCGIMIMNDIHCNIILWMLALDEDYLYYATKFRFDREFQRDYLSLEDSGRTIRYRTSFKKENVIVKRKILDEDWRVIYRQIEKTLHVNAPTIVRSLKFI